MTVRWKPLLVLSGLFALTAVVGVIAMAYTLIPKGSADILPSARAARAAKQYDNALIRYKQALQVDPKNPAIHEELAAMFGEWAETAPADKKEEVRKSRLFSLSEAVKYGKTMKGPRRALLAESMSQDEVADSLHWARELIAIEPTNLDAQYVLASEGLLESRNPNLPEVKRYLASLEEAKAPEVRLAMIKAHLAQATGDAATREAVLVKARAMTLPEDANPVDRSALIRLRALDVLTTTDPAKLAERVKPLQAEVRTFVTGTGEVPNRVMRLSFVLENVQTNLTVAASNAPDAPTKAAITSLVDGIEKDVEAMFTQALAAARKSNLRVYYKYASHLKFRNKRGRCLEVVDEALKTPMAALPTSNDLVMSLHEVAVVDALADPKDDDRFNKAAPHIKTLLGSSSARFQGLGHLFQGAIEMERCGMGSAQDGAKPAAAVVTAETAKLRSSALSHLKQAASQLPDEVEAQARYGVALIVAQEQGLGRQYLQKAMRLGMTEPQFQLWAAWSMVQAGYPEEAEPIVDRLASEMANGRVSRDYEATLHLLNGEIHQVKRSPEELKLAQAEFEKSYTGTSMPSAVALRMAQIDIQLGHPEAALKRVETLKAGGQDSASVERLAVVTLFGLGKKAEARAALDKARQSYPESDDLATLDATLLLQDKKAKEADAVLADFLKRQPENLPVVLMRSQVLSDLGDKAESRRQLVNVADRSENSAPLVQLAMLDLREKDYDAVMTTISKVRARWKEAPTADLLDAQLALDQGNPTEALTHFDAALKKDPGNKVVQYWKARIESRNGSSSEAAKAFETIASQGSTKEIEDGLSVTAAAQSALANLALQNGDVDAAIKRFETLRQGGALGGLSRTDRWQLAAAYTVKGQWSAARREIKSLLDDPKETPSLDERVRAANFYRQNKDDDAAVAQLDYVLALDPTHLGAVVSRAVMLADTKKLPEAAALLRKGIDSPRPDKEKAPADLYLWLAAVVNTIPPETDAARRALVVIDQGLVARPKSPGLVQAKYRLLVAAEGPKAALSFVESEAKDDPKGAMTRLLADVYRDQGELDSAETTLSSLVAKNPKDVKLATALIQVVATQATKAGDLNDRVRERSYLGKVDTLIHEFRAKFPNEVAFLQEDCEQAFRRGDIARATTVTQEIDRVSKNSAAGPLLRARLLSAQGRTTEAADAYTEALNRNPRQPNVRMMLGQVDLAQGKVDEAFQQAKLVLEAEPDRGDALILAARSLARPLPNPVQTAANQAKALELLNAAVYRQPRFSAGYHMIAEVRLMQGNPDAALKALRAGVDAVPDDALGIAQIVELLARPGRDGRPAAAEQLAQADELAKTVAARDTKGGPTLAVAVGFHKAGQLDRAREWADKASGKLDTPVVHMNYGDILLSCAERSKNEGEAKGYYDKAVGQYDLVLKTQANSIEAVNNKAWILHSYFKDNKKALELASGLASRVDPSILPGEFFDTMGAIQESLGNTRAAEESYSKGLRKSPNHPVLNYHMAKLISGDNARANKVMGYLEKANAQKDKLPPSMAADVALLMERAGKS